MPQLQVKQYIPNDEQPKGITRTGITTIAAHCNGFVKEVYEPFWEDLLHKLNLSGVAVNSIWMADVANQGSSGVLNEQKVGSDTNWFDHSRDLLLMINHFRRHITRPVIGIGHSMGASQIVHLSHIHPRLFHSVLLFDPIISRTLLLNRGDHPLAKVVTFRRDVWPSYSAAAKSFKDSQFYKKWDPRALNKLVEYGFRQGPTQALPNIQSEEVTMVTSKHQEAFTVARANFENVGVDEEPNAEEKVIFPDLSEEDPSKDRFYRPEMRQAFHMLRTLRPAVLFVFGNDSQYQRVAGWEELPKIAGTEVGGSGGRKFDRVKEETIDGGHFFPFENPKGSAEIVGGWVASEVERSKTEERMMEERWNGKQGRERQVVDENWVKNIKEWKSTKPKTKL